MKTKLLAITITLLSPTLSFAQKSEQFKVY